RGPAYQIANQVCNNAVSGTFFAHTLPVSTTLSQGCAPIGTIHTVTKADDYTILEIDDRRA
ncbi:MAG: histidine kinase, partial [Aliifodinibius sp.]|nr:histidine kinase [Phycisphaerae bacterium]NIT60352.1 histidine kinase [Fodinibius sp.]NIW48016.1 histidine kinase [Gammaproteobacteria bacterium]NIX02642.1 histidine kinase [Phycisphaerae bacterium]NIY28934.1 histidine kinase [Fodinibius sp.]